MGTRQIYVEGTDRAYQVGFPEGIGVVESANGGVEIGQIIIDDPDGTYDGLPLNAAYIEETLAAPTRLWTGYILNQTESRGPYRSGPGRIVTCQTMDINRNLYIRAVLSKNGYRPAETDLARVTWLLGNAAVDGLVYSGAFTNLTDNPINLDAADYRDQRPGDVLSDFTPVAGKRAFVFWNSSTNRPELFYDVVDAALYDASASITNNLSDLTAGIYAPDPGAEWERSGEDIASEILLVYKGTGRVVSYNATTKSTYGEFVYVYTSDRIGELATAQSIADAYVATHNAPTDTLTFTVQLPRANVNDLLAGERFQAKFTHFTGLTAWTWLRITKREVHVDQTGDYLVTIEATNHVNRAIGSGRGGGIPFPPPSATPPTVVQAMAGFTTAGLTWPTTPTPGNWFVVFVTNGNVSYSFDPAWTLHPDNPIGPTGFLTTTAAMAWRPITSSDTTSPPESEWTNVNWYAILEVTGDLTSVLTAFEEHSTLSAPAAITSGTITTSASAALLIGGAIAHPGNWPGNDNTTITHDSAWTHVGKHEVKRPPYTSGYDSGDDFEPVTMLEYKQVTTTGTYSPSWSIANVGGFANFGGWGGLMIAVQSTAADNPPTSGQQMPWAEVSMTTVGGVSTGTTAFPYADGTLEVKVQSQTILPTNYTETDGATGDFALAWEIGPTEHCYVRYVAR